jgi:tetratricopeptide (TPR) repeat protein
MLGCIRYLHAAQLASFKGEKVGDKEKTFQNAVRHRQQAIFVGRTVELQQFRMNLTLPPDDPNRKFIFCVHGDGGVGKTFLLRRWRNVADVSGAASCWVDEPVFEVPVAMRAIASDLTRQGKDVRGFTKLLDGYLQRRSEAEADPNAPSGMAAFMTQAAVRMGLHAAHAVPGMGGLADSVDADALAEQANQLRVFLGKKFRRHEDVRMLLSPLDVLTPALVRGIAKAGRHRGLMLFFDTYEQIGPVLDNWLRSVLDGVYGNLPPNLVVTIAGRRPLDRALWAPYEAVLANLALTPFTETEARQMLVERGVTDERTTQVILNLSGRLPLLLATLAEGRPADPDMIGDPSGDAVERFLKWEPDPDKKTLAVVAALPRTVNEDVLGTLVGGSATADGVGRDRLFAWLRSLPFVTDNGGRCQYHDVVREVMVRLERRRSPTRWKERHRALAAAFHGWRLGVATQDGWDDPEWRALRLEEAYHLLCADPIKALPAALSDISHACADRPATGAQWAQMISQAGADADSASLVRWGNRLEEALRIGQDEGVVACLEIVIREGRLGPESIANARWVRGRVLYILHRYAEALIDFNQVISVAPAQHRFFAYRGGSYLWLRQHQEALADLDRAIEIDPDDDWALAHRGETYLQMERQEEALTDFDRAIDLDPDYQWALTSRGETFREMGRNVEALANFDRAIELDPGDGWALSHRGETFRRMGRYEEALSDFDRAIYLDADDAWALTSRGETFRQTGRYAEALDDFNRCMNLEPLDSWHHYACSLTYACLGQRTEAARHLAVAADLGLKAIQSTEAPLSAFYDLGLYRAAENNFNKARECYSDAIERSPGTHLLDQAVDDLNDLITIPGVNINEISGLTEMLVAESQMRK